ETDPLVQFYDLHGYGWRGSENNGKDIKLCTPPDLSFDRDARWCVSFYHSGERSDEESYFVSVNLNENETGYHIAFGESAFDQINHFEGADSSSGFMINTVEDAKRASQALALRVVYAKALEQEEKGLPYRLGLFTDDTEYGVVVNETVPGMGADGTLFPYDLIVSVDGKEVNTTAELMLELQKIGLSKLPHQRYATFRIHRKKEDGDTYKYDMELKPCSSSEPRFCLSYVRSLDPRVEENETMALLRGFAGGVFWGFDGALICVGNKFIEDMHNTTSRQSTKQCSESMAYQREILKETNPDTMNVMDFLGSMTSPSALRRFVFKTTARKSFRNILINAAEEGWQGALSSVGQVPPGGKVLPEDFIISTTLGAVMGASVEIILGK
ncbi:PDZ domain-containing protein, partial [bacterium]|nr:PDZ domain-containing protein [bacterium]